MKPRLIEDLDNPSPLTSGETFLLLLVIAGVSVWEWVRTNLNRKGA